MAQSVLHERLTCYKKQHDSLPGREGAASWAVHVWGPMAKLTILSPLYTLVEGKVPLRALDHELSFPVQGHEFHRAFLMWKRSKGKYGWDGRNHLFHKGTMTFPTGLVPRVLELFRKLKQDIPVVNKTVVPVNGKPFKLTTKMRDYQDEAIVAFLKAKRGVIEAPTGAGKTLLALGAASKLGVPTLILAHTRSLVRQWSDAAHHECKGRKIAVLVGGKWKGDPMTATIIIASLGSLGGKTISDKKKKFNAKILARIQFLVGDEVHHSPSKSFTKIVAACDAYYRLGVSATPFDRADGTGLLLEAYFGPKIHAVQKSRLVEAGHLARGYVAFLECDEPSNLEARKRLTYNEAYKAGIVHNDYRNKKIAKAMAVQAVKYKKQVLCLVKEIVHGYKILEATEEYVDSDRIAYVTADTPQNIVKDILAAFADGEIDVLIASPVFGEGVDIPSVDVVVIADSGKSVINNTQKIGRGTRTNKGKKMRYLVIDVLDTTHKYLMDHSEKRIDIYDRQGLHFVDKPRDAWAA